MITPCHAILTDPINNLFSLNNIGYYFGSKIIYLSQYKKKNVAENWKLKILLEKREINRFVM
jgi:hypothetical protein